MVAKINSMVNTSLFIKGILMQQHTLPIFRVAGLKMSVSRENAVATAQKLHQQFIEKSIKIEAFSTTIYVIYQYQDNNTIDVVVGRLVSTDYELPENVGDVWIAPQNYVVFNASSPTETWQQINQLQDLSRRWLVDFETYPVYGLPKIYVGITGEVDMTEA